MTKKYVYFAYGSNLHKEHMKNRCPKSEPIAPAILPNYYLTFRGNGRGVGVADVKPGEGIVYGALYRVTRKDVQALDRYEGYPRLYTRKSILVFSEGDLVEAFVYVMQPHYEFCLPSTYYLRTIATGYRDWKLPLRELLNTVKETEKLLQKSSRKSRKTLDFSDEVSYNNSIGKC